MKRYLSLNPDLKLLEEFGYAPELNVNKLERLKKKNDSILIELVYLKTDASELKANFKAFDYAFKDKQTLDTFMFIAVNEADNFHGKMSGAYELYNHQHTIKEIASFLLGLQKMYSTEFADSKSEISLKMDGKSISSIKLKTSFRAVFEGVYNDLAIKLKFAKSDSQRFTIDNLKHLASLNPEHPRHLIGKLQMIFIESLRQFLNQSSLLKPFRNSNLTSEQRSFIYEVGALLSVFENDKGYPAEYIDALYRTNIKFLEK